MWRRLLDSATVSSALTVVFASPLLSAGRVVVSCSSSSEHVVSDGSQTWDELATEELAEKQVQTNG